MKRIRPNRLSLLFSIGLFALNVLHAVPPPAGVAPVAPPPNGFAIDGDLLANTPTADVGDWVANTNLSPGLGGGVLSLTGVPLDPTRTFHIVDPYNDTSTDRIFSGGDKWLDNPNTWGWTYSKPSSKTDINNALLHLALDTNGHVWAVLAADRYSTSGDSYIDFELLQNPLVRNDDRTFTSAGPHGGRTTNDLLLSLAFTGGGKVADFFAWRWMPNGSGGYTYVNITPSLPAGGVFVALNSNTVATPFNAFGGMSYAANAFAEAAIDLTTLLAGFDPCESFGFETIMIKTKASSSSSAGIEDFIDPIAYNLNIGPSANAGPDQVRCTEGVETLFPLTGTTASGIQPIASNVWSVVSGAVTIDDPLALTTTAHVASPSATLRLTVYQVNGCSKSDDIVLAVQQPPTCAISGPDTLCPRTTNTYSGPAGMTTYAWSVSGNGFISGATNQATVKVVAGAACGQPYTLALTTRSNACTVSCATEVLVTDTTLPVLTCPPDRVLDCPANTTTNATGVATATDSCSRVTVTYVDVVTNGCGVAKVIARTWTATDECGNSVSCTQMITVRDITPPAITCPPNRLLDCPADTSPAANGVATASDLCGAANVTFNDVIATNCGNTYVITRTWTATDLCGNSASCVQTLTVRDVTPPVITCPANLTLECPADTSTNATGRATATDACNAVTLSYTDSITNQCGGTFTLRRTWTATDACGNQSSCLQIITVRDTTAPVITCPPNRTLDCPADTSTNNTGVATATDTCGTATITYSDVTTNSCGATKTILRTWRAVDQCGNAATCVQTISVRDITPPTLTCPPDLTLECPANTTTNATGRATAADACSSVTISYSDNLTSQCGGTMTIARRWTATDACGNQSSCTQTITVRDTTPPVITCPPSLTLDCPANTSTNATGMATATDSCSAVSISFSDAQTSLCGNTKIISRTWRATDACGNSSTCVQTLTVRDITPPMLTIPLNATVECGGSTVPTATGQATATDTCNSVNVSYSDSVSNLCGNARIILRRWVAMDSCNNSNVAVQTITVRDTTPPVLTLPPNRVLNCPANTTTNNTGRATASDICSGVTISYSDVVSNSCGITKTIWRTWTAMDQCGNSANGVQTIQVVDTPPTISCPTISVQCVGDLPPPYASIAAFRAGGGVANDACDADLDFVLVSNSVLVGSCPARMTRVYRVTDDCGLTAQCSQTIVVDDTIAPTLTCPPSVTVECGGSIEAAVIGAATATDNCSTNVLVTSTDNPIGSTYNLNWYASDGDSGTGPYGPTFLHLGPGSLPCPSGGRAIDPLRNAVCYAPSGQLDALTSMGNTPMSRGQIVPYQLVIQAGGGPGSEKGVIEVTCRWSTYTTSNERFGYDTNYMMYCAFVDAGDPGSIDPHFNAKVDSYSSRLINSGGNSEQIEGTIRVSGLDSGDRVIVEVWMVLQNTVPDHVGGTIASELYSYRKLSTPVEQGTLSTQTIPLGNLNKLDPLPPPQTQPPAPPIPPQPPVPPGATMAVIDRTWRATDDCGNSRTCVQRITVRDTTAPSLTAPPDVTLECPADTSTNATGVALVQDACGVPSLSFSDFVSTGCGATRTILRTWKTTDGNNNTNQAVQTITVVDSTPPSLGAVTNKSIAAGQALTFDAPSVTDGCGLAILNTLSTTTNLVGENILVTRTWSATDVCGNESSGVSQVITIIPPAGAALTRLTIAPNGSSGVLLRWPTNAVGYRLECSTSPDASKWNVVPVTPIVTNGECRVYLPKSGHCQLFRLANTAPYLESARMAGGNLRLSWAMEPSGFLLEASDTMAPGSWSPVVITPGVSNAMNHVTLPMAGAKKFYRLKK